MEFFSGFGRLIYDIKHEFVVFSQDLFGWFQRAEDAERLIILCVYILLLLGLFAHKSSDGRRKSGSVPRQFMGALMFVCLFAFATGWVLEARHEYGFLRWLI